MSPYGEEEEEVDGYASQAEANGGWNGDLPSARLGTLQNAATSGIGGAIVGGLLNGKKGAVTGGLIGAGLGILTGGEDPLSKIGGSVASVLFGTGGTGADTPSKPPEDWRVKISMAPPTAKLFYEGSGIMSPLKATKGLVFPTTPTVTVTHQANYNSAQLTHNNYKSYFYQGSDVASITIAGEFTAQTITEANYVNGAIHFLRACTKMFFGTSSYAGNPPPMVFLSGYGSNYFPNVPCVITNFSHTMPNDVDYINTGSFWTPTSSTLNVTLQPIYSRQKQLQFGNDTYNSGGYFIDRGFI